MPTLLLVCSSSPSPRLPSPAHSSGSIPPCSQACPRLCQTTAAAPSTGAGAQPRCVTRWPGQRPARAGPAAPSGRQGSTGASPGARGENKGGQLQRRERRCRMRCSADNPPRQCLRSTGSSGCGERPLGPRAVRGSEEAHPGSPRRPIPDPCPPFHPAPRPRPRSPRLMPRHKGTDLH